MGHTFFRCCVLKKQQDYITVTLANAKHFIFLVLKINVRKQKMCTVNIKSRLYIWHFMQNCAQLQSINSKKAIYYDNKPLLRKVAPLTLILSPCIDLRNTALIEI